MPTNLHKKLFQSEGTNKLLRPDIIPWDHYAAPEACSVVQSRQVFPSDLAKGAVVNIEGLKYLPSQLMVFVNGVKLSPGIGYAEGEADGDGYCSEITLLIGVLEGDAIKFVAHNGIGVYYSELKYTVAPESATSLSYCPLDPSRLADGTSISIDWGDGTSETLEAGSSTSTPVHTYATNDKTPYQITLKATVETWAGVSAMFFGTSTTVSLSSEPEDNEPSTLAVDHSSSRVRYLVSVDTPIPTIGSTTRAYMFYNNRLLASLPSDLFQNQASEITSYYSTFYYCQSLASIPSGLFANSSKAEDFQHALRGCSALVDVAADAFDGCVSAANIASMFRECAALKGIPEGLFDSFVSVSRAENTFADATALETVPAGLFSKCAELVSASDCFSGCESLKSVPERLFAGCSKATTFSRCFYHCVSVEELSDSVFEGCVAADTFLGTFYECQSLKSLPGGMFSSCVNATNFHNTFRDCESLETVDRDVFKGCSSASTFEYCFEDDFSLKSLPSGLFDDCADAASFTNCFINCTALADVPAGLFKNLDKATDFSYVFYSCSSLETVPGDIFSGCSAIENMHSAFNRCSLNMKFELDLSDAKNVTDAENFANDAGEETDHVLILDCESVTAATFESASNANVWSECWASISTFGVTLQLDEPCTLTPFLPSISECGIFDITKLDIDWGDGRTDDYASYILNDCTHTYNTAGEYSISIKTDDESWSKLRFHYRVATTSDDYEQYYSNWKNFKSNIVEVTSLPPIGGVMYSGSSAQAIPKTELAIGSILAANPDADVDDLIEVYDSQGASDRTVYTDSVYGLFQGCSKLKTVASNLFKNVASYATDFQYVFADCDALEELPAYLFCDLEKANDFGHCFSNCTSLKKLPSHLFHGLQQADINFIEMFDGCLSTLEEFSTATFSDLLNCTGITQLFAKSGGQLAGRAVEVDGVSVPENVIENCPKLTSVYCMFYSWSLLSSIDPKAFHGVTTLTNVLGLVGNTVNKLQELNIDFTTNDGITTVDDSTDQAAIFADHTIPPVITANVGSTTATSFKNAGYTVIEV